MPNHLRDEIAPIAGRWLRDHRIHSAEVNLVAVLSAFHLYVAELGDGEPSPPSQDWAEKWAKDFHDTYERTAPKFGYQTREESAVPWAEVPENNRKLMISVCAEVLCRFEKWRSGAAQEVSPPSLNEKEIAALLQSHDEEQDRADKAEGDTRELKAALKEALGLLEEATDNMQPCKWSERARNRIAEIATSVGVKY